MAELVRESNETLDRRARTITDLGVEVIVSKAMPPTGMKLVVGEDLYERIREVTKEEKGGE